MVAITTNNNSVGTSVSLPTKAVLISYETYQCIRGLKAAWALLATHEWDRRLKCRGLFPDNGTHRLSAFDS